MGEIEARRDNACTARRQIIHTRGGPNNAAVMRPGPISQLDFRIGRIEITAEIGSEFQNA